MIGRRWRWFVVCVCSAGATTLPGATAAAAPLEPTALPAPPGSEVEPNDSPAQATPIQSGTRVRANLASAGDIDYYAFEAHAGEQVYAATIAGGAAGAPTDPVLTLVASDGATPLAEAENGGGQSGFASSIAGATVPSDGTYYLRVRDVSGGAAPAMPYDLYLQLRSGPPTAETEPNGTSAQANSFSGGEVRGVHEQSDKDWFAMSLQAGDTVFLSLDSTGELFGGRLGFGLVGDGNKVVLSVTGMGPSRALTVTVSRARTYFARVDAPSEATGSPAATYNLSATVIPAAQPSCRAYRSTGGPILDGGTVTFPIEVGDAVQVARAAVRLELEESSMADLEVALQDPAGAQVPLLANVAPPLSGTEPQEQVDAVFDDYAAIPAIYRSLQPLDLQPQGILAALRGRQAQGTWSVDITDDAANPSEGSLRAAELILCPEAGGSPIAFAPANPPAAAPRLSGFRISPRRFRAAKSGPTITKVMKGKGGATISYEDSSAAKMSALVSRATVGRKVGGKCVRRTAANATKKRCTRYLKFGRFSHADVAGRNRFRFSGRIAGKALPPGEYRLEAASWASSSGLKSAPVRATFTILPAAWKTVGQGAR